jgi:hypothetical protein
VLAAQPLQQLLAQLELRLLQEALGLQFQLVQLGQPLMLEAQAPLLLLEALLLLLMQALQEQPLQQLALVQQALL